MITTDLNTSFGVIAEKLINCVETTINEKVSAEIEYNNAQESNIVFTNTNLSVLGKIRASEELTAELEKCTNELKSTYAGLEVIFHPGRPSITISL